MARDGDGPARAGRQGGDPVTLVADPNVAHSAGRELLDERVFPMAHINLRALREPVEKR